MGSIYGVGWRCKKWTSRDEIMVMMMIILAFFFFVLFCVRLVQFLIIKKNAKIVVEYSNIKMAHRWWSMFNLSFNIHKIPMCPSILRCGITSDSKPNWTNDKNPKIMIRNYILCVCMCVWFGIDLSHVSFWLPSIHPYTIEVFLYIYLWWNAQTIIYGNK